MVYPVVAARLRLSQIYARDDRARRCGYPTSIRGRNHEVDEFEFSASDPSDIYTRPVMPECEEREA